jgi:hypothetical protein
MDEINTMMNVREAMITDLQTQLVTANAKNIEAQADLAAARAENEKLTAELAVERGTLKMCIQATHHCWEPTNTVEEIADFLRELHRKRLAKAACVSKDDEQEAAG